LRKSWLRGAPSLTSITVQGLLWGGKGPFGRVGKTAMRYKESHHKNAPVEKKYRVRKEWLLQEHKKKPE